MTDDLPTHLQALYHSGNVSGFISARMPSEKLTTGWIEQGLLQKALTGKLHDKKNQEQLIIPADRFARLTRDLEGTTHSFVGLLIIGRRGLTEPKLNVLVYGASDNSTESMTTVAFWTKNLNPTETIRTIARHAFARNSFMESPEPDLDYIEQLKADVSTGLVQNLLSLRVKTGKRNITEWLRDSIRNVDDSKDVIAYAGKLESFSRSALLLSRWITSLELFKEYEDNIAAILMKFENRMELCLWDNSQNFATFATIKGTDIEHTVKGYISAMWAGKQDLAASKSRMPEVVIATERQIESASKKSRTEVLPERTIVSLSEIEQRIEALESTIRALASLNKEQPTNIDQSISIVHTRLVEIIDRLATLTTRFNELEKKLSNVGKSGR
ncbi:MAG: hypothetical protein ACFFCT_00435 [Candidatus Odinarchaeota archaeon]